MAEKQQSSKYALIQKASSNMFVAVAVASFVVSFSIVTIGFLWDLRSFNSAVLDAQSETIRTLETNIANYETVKQQFDSFSEGPKLMENQGNKSNEDTVFDALPSKYDFPAVATAIQVLASQAGVALTAFDGDDLQETAATSEADPTPVPMPFFATVEGSYDELQSLLQRLDLTIRPYSVQRIQISGSDQNLRVNMDVETYYQPSINVDEVVRRSITE